MVLRIGHRGAAGYEPENTLRSFEEAVRLGADMVELDVHVCGSRELVVIHDETVDRTTDGVGVVGEMVLHELKALNAGKGERIPTLGEVFSVLRERIAVNIELKGRGTAEPVHEFLLRLVEESGWRFGSVLVTSFDWDMLSRMRELSAETRVGLLTYRDVAKAVDMASQLKAYSVNPHHGNIDAGFVEEAHSQELRVYPWTVNKPGDILGVLGMGVDGIISDFPDRVPKT